MPSTVKVTRSVPCSVVTADLHAAQGASDFRLPTSDSSWEGTPTLLDMPHHLVLVIPDDRHDRGSGRGSERADRGLLGRPGEIDVDVVRYVDEQIEVDG